MLMIVIQFAAPVGFFKNSARTERKPRTSSSDTRSRLFSAIERATPTLMRISNAVGIIRMATRPVNHGLEALGERLFLDFPAPARYQKSIAF